LGGKPNNRFIITERREKVFVLLSQGLNETEIAGQLNLNQCTISRDVKTLKKQSQKKLESIMEEVMPYEYEKCMTCIGQVTKECWKIYYDKSGQWTNKNKIDVLKLIEQANITRHQMLLAGPVTQKAMQIEQKVRNIVEEEEKPQQNYFNLGLPALKGKMDEDLR
jgi:DNA-binding CsgD family transcriptional regulator